MIYTGRLSSSFLVFLHHGLINLVAASCQQSISLYILAFSFTFVLIDNLNYSLVSEDSWLVLCLC